MKKVDKSSSAGTADEQRTEADNSTSASLLPNPVLSAALSVEEGNKLIAIFMGERVRSNYMIEVGTNFFGLGTKTLHRMEYHSSWDWLMPIVEKIEAMGIMMEITLSTVSVFSNSVDGFEDFYVKRNTKKEAIWVAVVEVIKWYNDNAVSVGSR